MSQYLEFVISENSTNNHILTSSPEHAVCVCCLAQNVRFVNLPTCKHTGFLNIFADYKEMFTNCVICHLCHNMLKKIEVFRRQVQQSILILKNQTLHSETTKLHNLGIFVKENITNYTKNIQKHENDQNHEYEVEVTNVKVENNLSDMEIEVPLLDTIGQQEACDNFQIVKKETLHLQTTKPRNLKISALGNIITITPEMIKHGRSNEQKSNNECKAVTGDVKMECDMQVSDINKQMAVNVECHIVNKEMKSKPIKREKAKKSSLLEEKYMGKLEMFLVTQEELQMERESLKVDEQYLRLPFRCDKCIIGFNRELYLKKHCKQRHDKSIGKYICGVCETVCVSKPDLDAHHGRHFIRYECKACSERYIDERSAVTHYNGKHDRVVTVVPEIHVQNEFQCRIPECGFKTLDGTHLRTHMQSAHTAAPYCVACRTHFRTNTILQQHLKHHSKHVTDADKKYMCDECDARFTMKSYLKSHIEWVHLKKDYQCPQCSKVLSTSRNLRRHIDFVHKKREMPRDKMCHYCGKGFSTRNLLQAHIRTHTGERPYKCTECSATFAQSGALYTHKRLVHNPLRGDTKRNKGKIK